MISIPFVEYLNKQIYYQITNNDSEKAIIFIHGSGGNSHTWLNQLNLRINYKLIAIDLPSHSKSDFYKDLSLDLYTDVLSQIVDTLQLKNVILCGHSLGGAVIQDYYFKFPNKVSGLILVGSGGRLRVSPTILETVKNDYNHYLDTDIIGAFYRNTPEEIILESIKEASKVNAEVTYSDFKICDNFDTLQKTSTIQVPCLIICGEEDTMTPVKYSKFFNDHLKTSELCIIEEAGHMVMVEKPREVNSSIKQFISKYY